MVEASVSSSRDISAQTKYLEALTSSFFGRTPFFSGESVRAFLGLLVVSASSDAFRLSGSRKSVLSDVE